MEIIFFHPPLGVRYIGVKKDTLSCTMERSIIYLMRVLEGDGHHPEPLISYFIIFMLFYNSLDFFYKYFLILKLPELVYGGCPLMDKFMIAAIEEAEKGLDEGGIPIGSVLVHNGEIIGRGHNRRVQKGSVILHGEMDALENAGRLQDAVYRECILYTTLSPCPMCSGAILLYKIPKVVIGENKTFKGEEELLRSSGVELEVLQDPTCIEMMSNFIKMHPDIWNEDICR
jgi:cytosine deaminase